MAASISPADRLRGILTGHAVEHCNFVQASAEVTII